MRKADVVCALLLLGGAVVVMTEGIRLGLYTERDEEEFRRQAELGRARVLGREPPFDRDWADWRPDPSWIPAELPAGWDRL